MNSLVEKIKQSRLYKVDFHKILICFLIAITTPQLVLRFNAEFLILTMVFSTLFGYGYYVLVKTQPRLIIILNMLVRYQINILKKKFYSRFTWPLFFENKFSLKRNDKYVSLKYYDSEKNKSYVYMFNNNSRSNDLIIFKDENGTDITDSIEPYLGPLQNFHGSLLTPFDFNHKKITVLRDGEIDLIKTFEEYEPIIFEQLEKGY